MRTKILLLSLAVVLALSSCGKKGSTSEDGDIAKAEMPAPNDTFTISIKKYPSGNIRNRIPAVKIKKNGKEAWVQNGEVFEYYDKPGEIILSKTSYKMGIREGETIKYYEDGKPYMVWPYINNKIDGVVKKYYPTGELLSEQPYKMGQLGVGTVEYNKDGKTLSTPELKVWFEDKRIQTGEYIVYAKLEKGGQIIKNAEFLEGMLINNKYTHPNLKPMKVSNGVASITYRESTGFPPVISITAKYVSRNRTTYYFNDTRMMK